MIKINLKPTAAQEGAFLGGVDISLINFKLVILAFFMCYIPHLVANYFWSSEIAAIEEQVQEFREKTKKLSEKEIELKEIQGEMEKILAKEKAIIERLDIIQEVVTVKKNPMKVLYEIALIIPSDVWLIDITYQGNEMLIKGNAADYKSIGLFLDSLKKIIFFDRQVNLDDYSTVTLGNKRRVESFKITAKIARYE